MKICEHTQNMWLQQSLRQLANHLMALCVHQLFLVLSRSPHGIVCAPAVSCTVSRKDSIIRQAMQLILSHYPHKIQSSPAVGQLCGGLGNIYSAVPCMNGD
ncbi:hypothetical protein AVEN_244129-1 [Araneus ventricosus]|uniref:Uncharacterized protein n=1 Tax=Araneus ventricosus TaxID=182803 RepID=A0A4Y2SYY2_ARAVE|nr:hypothetical protein AVEN_244129-1 [Araneus ventricosus]